MGRADGKDKEAKVVLDPITGKPMADYRINSPVAGPEELAEQLDDEITGPEPRLHQTKSRAISKRCPTHRSNETQVRFAVWDRSQPVLAIVISTRFGAAS